MTGLRERKKLRTRQEIADAAAQLFRARGFDAVTVEEIADAAGVSKKTVFNHFPAKEDLVFERAEEQTVGLITSDRDRPAGTSVLDAVRASSLAYCDELAGGNPGFHDDEFFAMVESSAVLAKRWHQFRNHQGDRFAAELAADAGSDPDDPLPHAVAAALLGAQRAVIRAGRLKVAAGRSPAEVAAWLRPQVDLIYDHLAQGFGGYLTR